MSACESRAIKKAERQRIDAFQLWRRLLRVPWTARRSNQSILKEISPEYSLEGLMLKLKLPILWPPDAKNWLTGKVPDAGEDWRQGGEGDDRGWDGWMATLTWWTWIWVSSGSWWWTGKPSVLQSMGSQRVGHDRATELNWTFRNMYTTAQALLSTGTFLGQAVYMPVLHFLTFWSFTLWLNPSETELLTLTVIHLIPHTHPPKPHPSSDSPSQLMASGSTHLFKPENWVSS